jgi:signal peptidase I
MYFSLVFIAGLLFGFGKNPMFTSLFGFIENIWIYASFVILTEIIRIMLIKNTPERRKVWTSIAIILVFTFVQIENLQSVIRFDLVGQIDYEIVTILPLLVVNAMLTYVAFSGSLSALIILRATYALMPVFLPVLPNISKILWSIMVYVVIFIGFVIYDHLNFVETRHPKWQKYSWKAFIIPGALVALCIMFGSGLMPWQPLAVASSSMTGTLNKGSIAFVRKMPQERVISDVKIGDIIQYKASSTMILHRVIEIKNDYLGEIVYVTKGDKNPAVDVMPVKVSQVVGAAKAYIPFLGWPAVWMSEMMK